MSITVSNPRPLVNGQTIARQNELQADHNDGWHVGRPSMWVECRNCRSIGDMPYLGNAPRSAEELAEIRVGLTRRNDATDMLIMAMHEAI
ncbi:hypothetical protein [Diaminobutyricimonas sp. TR449]|uniref:hypothetical protein n=1 Tax=Diaminobutyricimonas sp. TR449 TaxID=2708076 RepID=UPI0014235F08|nr:hypothetical protein [Diaminobutyricimonas sp. TR449]